ncbi:MAG: hypothetical protein WAO76_07400 [Georgfuchsia sp.]
MSLDHELKATSILVQKMMATRFCRGTTQRSEAYQRGVLHILQAEVDGTARTRLPYAVGTAEADAYWAGGDEGHHLARKHRDAA